MMGLPGLTFAAKSCGSSGAGGGVIGGGGIVDGKLVDGKISDVRPPPIVSCPHGKGGCDDSGFCKINLHNKWWTYQT